MDNTFEVKNGKLVFEEDKIVIDDDAVYLRRMRFLSMGMFFLVAMVFSWDYLKSGNVNALYLPVMFTLLGVVAYLSEFFRTTQKEILLNEVKSIKIRRKFMFRKSLLIRLKNHKTREVEGIFNLERLLDYIKTVQLQK